MWQLVLQDELEVPLKNAYLDSMDWGDVNSDGHTDFVLVDTQKHRIEICSLEDGELVHALKFPVFEERLFERGGRGSTKQPRAVLVTDASGDGLPDS